MGIPHAKIFLLTLLLAGICGKAAADSNDSGTSATLNDYILPEYKSDGNRLQFILYGEKAVNLGAFVNLTNPHVDIVQDNITDINKVTDLRGVKPYPLGSDDEVIKKFWTGKDHSRALIFTTSAEYDKNTRILKGDQPLQFRSREMDINGIGFDADYSRRFIHIRSNVKVLLRAETRKKVEASQKRQDASNKSQANERKGN